MNVSTTVTVFVLATVLGTLAGSVPGECPAPHAGSGDSVACQPPAAKRPARLQDDESSLLHVSATVKRGGQRPEPHAAPAVDWRMPTVGSAGLLLNLLETEAETSKSAESVQTVSWPRRSDPSLLQTSASRLSAEQSGQASARSDAMQIMQAVHGFASWGYAIIFCILLVFICMALYWVVMFQQREDAEKQELQEAAAEATGSAKQSPRQSPRGSSATGSKARLSPVAPGTSPGAAHFREVASNNMSPMSQGIVPLTTAIMMSPELDWAIVPPASQVLLVLPMLANGGAPNEEISMKFKVGPKDGAELLELKFLRHKMDDRELAANGASEYITLGLPLDDNQDLVMCWVHRLSGPTSPLESKIYVFGSKFFGTVREDPGGGSYTLILASGQPALTATVSGSGKSRRVSIVNSQARDQTVAQADPLDGSNYEVKCFPLCDILVVVSMLSSIDRLAAQSSGT